MKNRALTLVIIGLVASVVAGVTVAIVLSSLGVRTSPNLAVGSVFVAVLALLFVVLIVEIVSAIKIDDSTPHTTFIAGCLVVLFALSTDMQMFFAAFGIDIPNTVFGILSEVAFIFATICCCWYVIYLYKLTVKRKLTIAIAATIFAVLLIIYSITLFYGYGYVAHFVIVALTVIGFCTILLNAERKTKIGTTTYFTAAVFCFCVGVQSVNALYYSGCTVAVPGISLVYAVLTFATFIIVYLMFSIRTDGRAVKSSEYKHRAELFETKALSGQIKPHFIFNSLEAVRALYHNDTASGDAAINHLSNFLRGSIYSFDSELIPFETEIDNVFNYAEFENLKRREKIDVIFNIDFTEFFVPPFSVQPFVENAIKYSGVDQIENGCIIISSYRSGGSAVVEISDNGKGFDTSKITENSHGIKNASGRFALTLGTTPEITSQVGSGTHVKIVIDLNKQKGNK